jgi:uncharacterized membrane protein YphA (DoxX/SURF4 family)
MTFSEYAGVAIMPTLARIVLCAAFIPAGYNKVFTEAEFDAKEADRLRQLGVAVTPVRTAMADDSGAGWRIVRASYRVQDATQPERPPEDEPPAEPASRPAEPESPPADPEVAPPDEGQAETPEIVISGTRRPAPPATAPVSATMFTAQAMHKVTLIVDNAGIPEPLWQARIAAYTELVGGALLALGLFSRLWGFGLAGVMAVAFYLTSFEVLQAKGWALTQLSMEHSNTMLTQAGLLALALGILFTGAGPLSLDRLLFGPRREKHVILEQSPPMRRPV